MYVSISDNITVLGNHIRSSRSGVDVPRNIFLLKDPVSKPGVLFAVSAYFRNDREVAAQIWRPYGTASRGRFRLISEVKFIPSVIDQREDVR